MGTRLEPADHLVLLRLRHQVHLVEQDLVGKGHLQLATMGGRAGSDCRREQVQHPLVLLSRVVSAKPTCSTQQLDGDQRHELVGLLSALTGGKNTSLAGSPPTRRPGQRSMLPTLLGAVQFSQLP